MPMSACSKTPESKPVDKPTAWACTLANIVTVPGLGSLAAGRKIGFVQAGLALAGFGLSLAGMLGFLHEWRAMGEYPEGFTPSLWVALVGMLLFFCAWFWALRTSVRLHRELKSGPAAHGPAPADGTGGPPPS